MGRKEKTLLITIIVNIVFICFRFFLANLSGSMGLRANAWHSFTDVFVTSVVLSGLLMAAYGAKKLRITTQKIENILAIFVSLFILYMGIEILTDAFSGEITELHYIPFAAVGAFLCIIVDYFMSRYKIYVGEQTGSQSLIADGYHSKMDMYCSIAVLIGLLGSLFGMPSLDKIAAIIAMILLLVAGLEILISNIRMLARPASDSTEAIEAGHSHSHHILLGKGRLRFRLLAGIGIPAIAAWFLSGIFIIQLDEIGIVRRLGKVVIDNAGPGIHYRLPFPIDEVTTVKKESVQRLTLGSQELLTGDTNLINIDVSVHYKVNNAANYILNVSDNEALLIASARAGIRKIIGENTIDFLLAEGRPFIEREALRSFQDAMDRNRTGIEVVTVQLIEVSPPPLVIPSFQDLSSARQDQMIFINEAAGYQNTVIPQAVADAYKQIADAEAYRDEKIKTAQGDAAMFISRQAAYSTKRNVTEFRLYMEAMEKILPNVRKILLGKNIHINNAELWITSN